MLTKKKLILFKTDLSVSIGLGHFQRCYNLATNLPKSYDVFFLINKSSAKYKNKAEIYRDFEFNFLILKDNKIEQIREIKSFLNKRVADLLIIDNYSWSYKEEVKLKDLTKRILVFDDLANKKHHCDVLINQVHGTSKSDYVNYSNKSCKLFLGSKYMLIR